MWERASSPVQPSTARRTVCGGKAPAVTATTLHRISISSSTTLITFAAPPTCAPFSCQTITLEIVKRHYTIGRIKGGMKFTCTRCPHHVSTLDCDPRDGNLRTQAATAINRHATTVHHEPVMFSSLDTQQRIWRT